MPKRILIRRNEYHDSVQLMLAAGRLQKWPDVVEAILMMGTPNNKEFLRSQALLSAEGETATPNDLIIALEADTAETLDRAQGELDNLLRAVQATGGQEAPRTVEAALRQLPGANLCLISVPGNYAAAEVRKALRAGLHVLLFSDNVPLDQERELKELARSRGLLCMGPDCGVVNLNGFALALASVVRRGPIGLAGASGAGIQEVSVLAERWGVGTSQAIGVGGRDLNDAVGCLSVEMALDALDADPETQVIAVVTPSSGPRSLEKLCARIQRCRKPVVAWANSSHSAALRSAGAHVAADLEDAAELAVTLTPGADSSRLRTRRSAADSAEMVQREIRGLRPTQRFVRGLFCAGTFLKEALGIMTPVLGPIHSNASLSPELDVVGQAVSQEHTLLDLGAEEFTLGRPHVTIDPEPRRQRLEQEANDPQVAVILLDIILGPAAHPDPAGLVADTIVAAKRRAAEQGRYLSVVAAVCGSEGDPQSLSRQEETLRAAGVAVVNSNAEAARLAARIVQRGVENLPSGQSAPDAQRPLDAPAGAAEGAEARSEHVAALFQHELQVINVGLALFGDALKTQGVRLVSLDWRPPAGGNAELAALLEIMGGA